eukprot:gene3158-13171_t
MTRRGGHIWEAHGVPTYQQFRNHAIFVPDLTDFAVLSNRQGLLSDRIAEEARARDEATARQAESLKAQRSVTSISFATLPPKPATTPASKTAAPAGESTSGPSTSSAFGGTYSASATAFGASGLLGRSPRTIIGQPLNAESATSAAPQGAQPPPGLLPEEAGSSPLWGMSALMAAKEPPMMLRETIPPTACPFKHVKAKFKFAKELMSTGQAKIAFGVLKELPGEWANAVIDKQMSTGQAKIVFGVLKELLEGWANAVIDNPSPPDIHPPVPALQEALAAKRAGKKAAPTELPFRIRPTQDEALAAKRAGKKAAPTEAPSAFAQLKTPSASNSSALHLVPMEGQLYISLLTGSYALTHDNLTLAKEQFGLAESGLHHFYEGDYSSAIEKLEKGHDLADVASRDLKSPTLVTARKNAATCRNNLGVCYLMLGQRAEATNKLQSAVELLTLLGPGQLQAKSNLRRTVRHSFAVGIPVASRPVSAAARLMGTPPSSSLSPPMTASSGGLQPTRMHSAGGALSQSVSMTSMTSSNERLQRFLTQAITMKVSMPPTAVPAWAVRAIPSDKDAKSKKGGKNDKKGKDKKKGEPKKKKDNSYKIAYGLPEFAPPQYSIANVPAEKKKKKAKKGAAADATVATPPLASYPSPIPSSASPVPTPATPA